MAAALALSLTLSSDQLQPHQRQPFISFSTNRKHPSLYFLTKSHTFTSFSSSPHTSSTTTTELTTSGAATYSSVEESFRTGRFLSNEELEKLKDLQDFSFCKELPSGSLCIRVMRPDDMDVTVRLLAESFSESMLFPVGYESFLRFWVKQYLIERKAVLPHTVALIGFYRGKGEEEEKENELAGTVEVCFDRRGANSSPPTPTPPKDSPYICNMTVKKSLRRKGIGWNLLKASEELISQMNCTKEKRKHLMYKKLSDEKRIPITLGVLASDSEHSSLTDMQT